MNNKVSVIVPFVNEFPQVLFTIRSIHEALIDKVDFEVIAINNWCSEVEAQGRTQDKSAGTVKAAATVNRSWLKVIDYDDRLSHWQAKNVGVQAAEGDVLWFCDAHCAVPGDDLVNMVRYYMANPLRDQFTLHLPLTYQILESRRLIYKLVIKPFQCDYSFTSYRPLTPENGRPQPLRVPVMSTCGMLMSRNLFEELGGFPKELGIYGGGEHFVNFVMGTLGKEKYIWPARRALYHHGDRRGYNWNSYDYLRNKAIATYLYADAAFLSMYLTSCRGRRELKQKIYHEVLERCSEHRKHLVKRRVIGIGEWVHNWMPEATLM